MAVTTIPAAVSANSLIARGLTAAAVAAVATAASAAAGKAAGISLVVGGAPIPVAGFATLTVIFSVLGLVLGLGSPWSWPPGPAVRARCSSAPRSCSPRCHWRPMCSRTRPPPRRRC
ncbi:hypothetical protein amrb99_97030 [Actinomadura sp. RB99]|nr:hypothetical protein [Actinomadura sp. RB99]